MISLTSQSNIDHQLDQDDDHDYWVGVRVGQLDLGAQSGGNSGKSRGTHTDLDIQNKHIICIIIGNIIGTIKNHIVQMFFIAICLNLTFQGADDQPDFAEKVMNNFYFNNSFVNAGAVNDHS